MRDAVSTVHLWKLLVHSFCKRGRVEEAELLGTEMESQGLFLDKVMYTNLINGYCKNKRMKMARIETKNSSYSFIETLKSNQSTLVRFPSSPGVREKIKKKILTDR